MILLVGTRPLVLVLVLVLVVQLHRPLLIMRFWLMIVMTMTRIAI
ncbi:Uncharacterised protein [Mycobacteroides abscessus subsp. abscessus]|nr:Uncharacterised protein [Mycobacteroides abscessus subsp. abscessus]